MNIFKIINEARENLNQNDLTFNEQSERMMGILRATGVLPSKRSGLNGHLHKLFSATLVTAYNYEDTLDAQTKEIRDGALHINTRKRSTWHEQGVSTQFISWLDKLVGLNFLSCADTIVRQPNGEDQIHANRMDKATGEVYLSNDLVDKLVCS